MQTEKHESPFEAWPGHIELPKYIDAQQFCDWLDRSEELDDDENEADQRPGILKIWDCRHGFIISHDLKLGKNHKGEEYEIEKTGLKLPSLKVALWFRDITSPLINDAQSVKNWLGRLDDTDSTTD